MTPARVTFYGTVIVLIALLIFSLTAAGVYYGDYQQASSQGKTYTQELDAALASYRSLSNSYNASLSDENRTLSLLTAAVASLNTSTPAYGNASAALASLWSSYQSLASNSGRRDLTYEVHVLLDYGNGTRIWYNESRVEPGWNAYLVTLVLLNGDIQAVWYPQYGEHLFTAVNGITNTQTKSWFLLTYDRVSSWQVAQVGADEVPVFNGTVFAWTYCAENSNYLPTCSLP
jgi:hypothetical protein